MSLLDPALLIPLLTIALVLVPRTAIMIVTWVVCLFSRSRTRRLEARQLLQILTRSGHDQLPPSG
jgi:hypothetical protein